MEDPVLKIEKMCYGGKGLGFQNGKAIFVDAAFPGEKVSVVITKDKKSHSEARVKKIISPSPERRESPCQYSESCGGCHWLEAKEKAQGSWKKNILFEFLDRNKLIDKSFEIEFIEANKKLNYRNKVVLRGELNDKKELGIGFFGKGSHKQIHVDKCLIADEQINHLISRINQYKLDDTAQKFRLELQVIPIATERKQAALIVKLHPLQKEPGMPDLFKK